jgi:tetraacyldisaccharide 4'-kinase
MLARNLPGVLVLVDKNRVKAGMHAIRRFGCDTLVLDDGFQYLPLKGRLNLLLVDKTNPFGNGFMLPRGILREPVKHLRRASYVFLTKSNGRRDQDLEDLIQKHNPGVDIIECAHRPQYLRRFGGGADGAAGARESLDALRGRRVAAFSGIAVPEGFEKFLKDLGAEIVCARRFMDHYRFTRADIDSIFAGALEQGVDFVVTTEKDAVRIDGAWPCPLPLYYLRLEIDILRGAADFDEAVERVCFPGTAALP